MSHLNSEMDYLNSVLAKFADDKHLGEYPPDSSIRVVYEAYVDGMRKAGKKSELTLDSTVADLRIALKTLNQEEQTGICEICPAEKPAEIEQRRLRHWLIRAGVIIIAPIPCMVVGAGIVIGVRTGVMPENAAFTSIITTATEILKLIFEASLN